MIRAAYLKPLKKKYKGGGVGNNSFPHQERVNTGQKRVKKTLEIFKKCQGRGKIFSIGYIIYTPG